MSRIGIQPIAVPEGVTVAVENGAISAKGPKGERTIPLPGCVEARLEGSSVRLSRIGKDRHARAMYGTMRSLAANLVEGVHRGFERRLEIQGVGYRAALEGRALVLSLGFSHPIHFAIPDGIEIKVDNQTALTVSGIDKQQVGLVSARIRGYAPAEPYKGKGVRYKDEQVRRKVGKAVS